MAYVPFDQTTPNSSQNGIDVPLSTKQNLAAVRDGIIANGFFPGWNAEMQDSDGSPTTTPEQPDQVVYSKGTERIKLSLTWGTAGGEDGNVIAILAEYSSDEGSLYEPMGDTGYPLGTMTLSYDSNGNYLSHTWS
ncbi:MAG: hypothetical protein JAY88_14795 [Candidatus Thiodiazotropha lotti]|nr:hypothetical protein [Candidatus Thiodiazotropha lotti]MCW4188332.1 hypothetical protein [Candidatus Thiodiazotropha lotti]